MELAQSASWVPPDTSHLQFHDCDVVATWSMAFFMSLDLPAQMTIYLVQDAFTEYWDENNITHPDPANEILPWAVDSGEPVFLQALSYTNDECKSDFCRLLPWAGNADLAGRGMVVNYCIQAVFVTLYIAVHMAARFGWRPRSRSIAHRVLTAVQESTRPFLDSALLFCVAVHFAAMFTFVRGRVDDDSPTPTTGAVVSVFIALYTIFPPLALHSCAAEHLRRKHGRRYIWSFVGALTVIMSGLYYSDPQSPWRRQWADWDNLSAYLSADETEIDRLLEEDPDHQLKWESFCVTKLGADRANWAFTIMLGIITILVLLDLIIVANALRIPFLRSERRPILRSVWRYRWVLSAFFALQAMWVCLGIFFWFRNELNKHAGQENKDRQWTFGQILAVATWAPVIMEFYVLWRDGAEKGLTGLLSDRYVVLSGDVVQHNEKDVDASPQPDLEGQGDVQARGSGSFDYGPLQQQGDPMGSDSSIGTSRD